MAKSDTSDKKRAFLEALEKGMSNVTSACRRTGIHRSTYYDWLEKDSDFRERVEEVPETVLDFVESKLFELINGVKVQDAKGNIYNKVPDGRRIEFFLETKGKKRGYIKRNEHRGGELVPPITGIRIKVVGSKSTLGR